MVAFWYTRPSKTMSLSDMSTDAFVGPAVPQSPHRDLDEASLAPRQGEMLSLPFDQYGRMRVAQNVVLALYGEIARQAARPGAARFTLRVLDVGGYPGVLRHFLKGDAYDVSVLDVVPDDGTIPG